MVIIWHLLSNPGARFADLGYGCYQVGTDVDRKFRHHIRQIRALGFAVTVTRAEQPYMVADQARSLHQARVGCHAHLTVSDFRSCNSCHACGSIRHPTTLRQGVIPEHTANLPFYLLLCAGRRRYASGAELVHTRSKLSM